MVVALESRRWLINQKPFGFRDGLTLINGEGGTLGAVSLASH
jgi:hypothetical protein